MPGSLNREKEQEQGVRCGREDAQRVEEAEKDQVEMVDVGEED